MDQKTLDNENAIIDCMLNLFISTGHCISVNDGEETILVRSTDISEIKEELRSTDSDWIRVFKAGEAVHVGSVLLVYNNGSEGINLISDTASSNLEQFDELLQPVFDLIDTL